MRKWPQLSELSSGTRLSVFDDFNYKPAKTKVLSEILSMVNLVNDQARVNTLSNQSLKKS